MIRSAHRLLGVVLALGLLPVAIAEVTVAPLFGDHAVLQRDRRLPIWGTARPGEKVTVTFRDQCVTAVAGADGAWTVWLEPVPASTAPAEITVSAHETVTVTVRDVLVGEVWLASGQSNMAFSVSRLEDGERALAQVELPLVRELKIEQTVAGSPARHVPTGGWQLAAPPAVGAFSAVGYFFARELQQTLQVPVGIVNSTWGGTPIESWMSDAARSSTSVHAAIEARWEKAVREYPPELLATYPAREAAWLAAEETARATKTKNPLAWPPPPDAPDSPSRPGGLFNAMIAPLQPMALRGILWYQGEGNGRRAGEYAELLKTMIVSWRAGWNDPQLPFYFVQLPGYEIKVDPSGQWWARLRQAQTEALTVPQTGMAVGIDLGETNDIHPQRKREVSRRLAAIALANLFQVPVAWESPMFDGVTVEGSRLRVRFRNSGGGLVVTGGVVRSLEIAGRDGTFHAASGAIEQGTLIVWSPEVPEPVAVRYCWANSPHPTLYNAAGLPVAPFRSDAW